MAMEKKVTKKDYFEAIKGVISGMETVGEYPVADVVAFIDKSIEQIDTKAAKAAETKAEGDALRAVVFEKVTETAQTADEITAAIGDVEVSRAKVIARLTQLVKSGEVVKEQVTVDGRKVMGYSRA